MECITAPRDVMGVPSGIFRYKPDGTMWKIEGDVCTGPSNCGYVTNFHIENFQFPPNGDRISFDEN